MRKENIIKLETTLDHLTGEEAGQALGALNGMDAILDAAIFTGIGKKNRPAWLLQVLCRPENEEAVVAAVFRHTHTLGLRRAAMERYTLERVAGTVERDGELLPAKEYLVEGMTCSRPEADAVADFCARHDMGAPAFRLKK